MRRALAALLLLASPGAAQERDAAARVEAGLRSAGFQGVFAVSGPGRRVVGGAMGEAAPGRPFDYGMIFPWASVTKQVVATMVMREAADGRIALDAPASRYLPALGAASPTVRQLLQHRSGLRNPDGSPPGADGRPNFHKGGPTGLGWCVAGRGSPGGRWRYNDCDYIVLGAMLERVRGRPLAEQYAARISGPTGIDARFVIGPGDPRADGNWAGGPDDAIRRTLARLGAAGGLVGTAEEMLAFDRALMDGTLLPPRALAELWRGDPAQGHQALGQRSFAAPLKGCAGPVRIVERRGAVGPYQVRNFIVPDRGLAAVLLTNRGEGRFGFGEVWRGEGVSFDMLSAAACP